VGYTTFYRYRWAGRADSTAVEMNDAWWLLGQVGTDAGSEKDTEDWVGVTKVDLPNATGNLHVFDEPQRRVGGDGETELEIILPSLVFRARQPITGAIVLTPQKDMSDAELGVYWGFGMLSHPLEKTPAAAGGTSRALPLPTDVPPTGSAVHSTLIWFVEASMLYAKWTHGIEKVRRQIVVVNA
jgi:hypothetical protein